MTTFFNAEEVDSQLELEFVEEVNDTMAQIEVILGNLRSNSVSRADALATLKRMAHSLRFIGRSSAMPMAQIATQRMDDYIVGLHDLASVQIEDIQTFADKISAIVNGEINERDLEGGEPNWSVICPPKKRSQSTSRSSFPGISKSSASCRNGP